MAHTHGDLHSINFRKPAHSGPPRGPLCGRNISPAASTCRPLRRAPRPGDDGTEDDDDLANIDFRWNHSFPHSNRNVGDAMKTPRTMRIQPKLKSALVMKSALIKRIEGKSCAPQRRRSLGNSSIEREGHDEIGSRSRTDPERVIRRRHSMTRQTCDRTILRFVVAARTGCLDPPCKAVELYSFCEMSITLLGTRTGTDI